MCGIIGIFGKKDSLKLAKAGIKVIKNRGKDNEGYFSKKDYTIGHCLHSVVGAVKQPLVSEGALSSNCEIYNWKELNKKYNLNAKNDSQVLLKLLEKQDPEKVLDELDGVYAFVYLKDKKLILARDILGVKPLWFSHVGGFSFCSEKKALEKLGFIDINELNPRKILIYDLEKDRINFKKRNFFDIFPETKESKEKIIENVKKLAESAISKRVPERKFGILFSGGIDSTFIAVVLKKLGIKFNCYTSYFEDPKLKTPEDLVFAKKAAQKLGLNLKISKLNQDNVKKYLKKIVPLIEDSNVVKVGVALTFYAACEKARKDGCKIIFSGLGSEEIFGGYERHKLSSNINKECVSGLLKMYERDNYRDDVITMNNNLELRLPFLDKKLVDYALKIPGKYKIADGMDKKILRDSAEGVPEDIIKRKKKAAQYGSNFHKSLKKLSKKNGFKRISSYLRQFYPSHNVKLGALVSSGKDSIFAMHVMQKQNYEISCMITLKSQNPDSYMFHTPAIDMADLQAKSIGLPLIVQQTKGEKEKELSDLKKALAKAKKEHKIEGVVTGALFSNYQRDRVEKVADSLGLKIFAPLWHINQETYMREVIDNGYKFIMTKIMAEGLDKKWLNKIITLKDVDRLAELDKKIGFNIAGEGGEYETLMTDGPMFSKRIEITDFEIKEESKIVAELKIKKARLV